MIAVSTTTHFYSFFRCKELLDIFEKTYVGKSPYYFPETEYEPAFVAAPFTHPGEKVGVNDHIAH